MNQESIVSMITNYHFEFIEGILECHSDKIRSYDTEEQNEAYVVGGKLGRAYFPK